MESIEPTVDKEKQLRRDVRFLGNLLGETLIEQEGRRIFDIVEKMRFLTKEMRRHYGVERVKLPIFLSFGSWVGGDRDGNPYVTHKVTYEVLRMQKRIALEKYIEEINHIKRQLSSSAKIAPVNPELLESVEEDRKLIPEEINIKKPSKLIFFLLRQILEVQG